MLLPPLDVKEDVLRSVAAAVMPLLARRSGGARCEGRLPPRNRRRNRAKMAPMGTSDRPDRRRSARPPARRRVLRGAGFLLALGLGQASCTPQCAPPTPAPAPVRYDVRTIVGGLENPWDLAWTPTGTLLVTERSGDINAVGGGVAHRIGRPADVVADGEGGMMGLAVDPRLRTNGFIYACYLTPSDVRVVRFRVGRRLLVAERRATADHRAAPVEHRAPLGVPGPHRPGRPVCGSRRATPPSARTRRTRGRSAARCCASAPTASIPPGNMGAPFRPEIYAYGFRNPQGITFRSDGMAFVVEHGSNRDDEITPLGARRQRRLEPGAGLQRVGPDDRPVQVPQGAAPRVVVGVPDDRPVRRHVRDVEPVGHAGPDARRDGRAQGPAPPPRQRDERRVERRS